jgi:hypothetical protein
VLAGSTPGVVFADVDLVGVSLGVVCVYVSDEARERERERVEMGWYVRRLVPSPLARLE